MITGSISNGTLRDEDLVPAFLDELRDLSPLTANTFEAEREVELAHLKQGLEHFGIDSLVSDLIDLLNVLAPKGLYFGTVEGDGADFGWWSTGDDSDGERLSCGCWFDAPHDCQSAFPEEGPDEYDEYDDREMYDDEDES